MSEVESTTETEPTTATTAEATPDPAPWQQLTDQMGEMTQRFDAWQQQITAEPEPEAPAEEPDDLSWIAEDQLDPADAQRRLDEYVQGRIDAAIKGHVAPIEQRFVDEEFAKLEQSYPALQDPKVAKETLDAAQLAAHELGHPELAGNPRFVERVFKAELAAKYATQETPANASTDLQLESGGPAGQQPDEPDLAQQILNAGGRNPELGWLTGNG